MRVNNHIINDLDSPKVSVVMPAYNGGKYICEAIESILVQTYKAFELIVVNDGSTDDSVTRILSFDDPRIRLIDRERNLGLAITRNEGVEAARGEYIAMLDCDDIACPTRLEEQVRFLDDNPDFGMVGSWVENFDEEDQTVLEECRFECDSEKIPVNLLFHNVFAQSAVMMRRSILTDAPYREDFPPAEDYDLWVRIASKCRIANLPRVLVKYRKHAEGVSWRKTEAMEASVVKNIRQQLERLGFEPDDKDLIVHRRIGLKQRAQNLEELISAENWLMRIAVANRRTAVYSAEVLESLIGQKWHRYCSISSNLGCDCYRIYWSSNLCPFFQITPAMRLAFGLRCLLKR